MTKRANLSTPETPQGSIRTYLKGKVYESPLFHVSVPHDATPLDRQRTNDGQPPESPADGLGRRGLDEQ